MGCFKTKNITDILFILTTRFSAGWFHTLFLKKNFSITIIRGKCFVLWFRCSLNDYRYQHSHRKYSTSKTQRVLEEA